MGMYTELRVRATIKPKYRDLIALIENNELEWAQSNWNAAAKQFPKFPWLKDWAAFDRSSMIPRGGSTYFDDDPAWVNTFDPETGFWQFQCNLKNYSGTIEHFLARILPELAEHVTEAWEHYEEADQARKVGITCFS